MAAKTLIAAGDTGRTLWLFDTYEGMPPPEAVDRDYKGTSAADRLATDGGAAAGTLACSSLEEVQATMRLSGYPSDRTRFVAGKVEDTIPATCPERIALLRLDTDWFASTYHEMTHLYPRLVSGGVMIIDDYGHWSGAKDAIDRYLSENRIPLFLNRLDYTGRLAVKP